MSHDTEEIWYFAYGSNLSVVDEKRKGRGDIHEAAPCRLPDYRLTFTKLGRDGTCKASITPDPAAEVWGVTGLVVTGFRRITFGRWHYTSSACRRTESGHRPEDRLYNRPRMSGSRASVRSTGVDR